MLLTFGVLLLLEDVIKMVWGGQAYYASAPFDLLGNMSILGHVYPIYFLLVMGVTLLTGISIWLFMTRSKLGIMMRAISFGPGDGHWSGSTLIANQQSGLVLGSGMPDWPAP